MLNTVVPQIRHSLTPPVMNSDYDSQAPANIYNFEHISKYEHPSNTAVHLNPISESLEEKKCGRKSSRMDSSEEDVDDEWSFTPPQYYNVKNASVKALDSYRYITKYKVSLSFDKEFN